MSDNLIIRKPSPTWNLELDNIPGWASYDNLFTKEECSQIIKYAKTFQLISGKIGDENSNEHKQIRDSKICFLNPDDEISWVYKRLTDLIIQMNNQIFKFDLFAFGECLQFTEYTAPSGKYDSHVDRAYGLPIRKLSIVLQLTDDNAYEGGDFQIFESDNPISLPRKQGTLLVFPSYTLHRVTEVTKGTRNSLVGWINGKPFK